MSRPALANALFLLPAMHNSPRSPKRPRLNYDQGLDGKSEITCVINNLDTICRKQANALHRQILLEEIGLEIGVRERVAETIEARIKWALELQQLLEGGQDGMLTFITDLSFLL
jgi:hypothetical protein